MRRYERLHYMDTSLGGAVSWSLIINEDNINFNQSGRNLKYYILDVSDSPVDLKLRNSVIHSNTIDIVTVDVWTLNNGRCSAKATNYTIVPYDGLSGKLVLQHKAIRGAWDILSSKFIKGSL